MRKFLSVVDEFSYERSPPVINRNFSITLRNQKVNLTC